MSIGMLYWVIWIVCIIFGGIGVFRGPAEYRWYGGGFSIVLAVLLFLIGWKLFGFVVHE